jgi:DNA-directed RNA polymerase beta subunit
MDVLQAYIEDRSTIANYHIRSFDHFLTQDMFEVIARYNPVQDGKVCLKNIRLLKPLCKADIALKTGQSYEAILSVDAEFHDSQRMVSIKDVTVAVLPIMVGSKPDPSAATDYPHLRGYFVLDGRRVSLPPRPMSTSTYQGSDGQSDVAVDGTDLVIRLNKSDKRIVVAKRDDPASAIPLFIFFRSLGIASDRHILQLISWRQDVLKSCFNLVYPSILHAAQRSVYTRQQACDYMQQKGWTLTSDYMHPILPLYLADATRRLLDVRLYHKGGHELRFDDVGMLFRRMFTNLYEAFLVHLTNDSSPKLMMESKLRWPGCFMIHDELRRNATISGDNRSYLQSMSELNAVGVDGSRYPGFICPVTNDLALTAHITQPCMSSSALETLIMQEFAEKKDLYVCLERVARTIEKYLEAERVYVNGVWIGVCPRKDEGVVKFVKNLKAMRERGQIHKDISISWSILSGQIDVRCDAGRLCRPLLRGQRVESTKASWNEMLRDGVVEYIDSYEQSASCLIAIDSASRCPSTTHTEMHPMTWLSAATLTYEPFINHAPIRRDPSCHNVTVFEPQRPLIRAVRMHRFTREECYVGQTVVVAFMVFAGLNQFRHVVVNQASIQRGLFKKDCTRFNTSSGLFHVGHVLPAQEMPFCPCTGLIPDIIINPHDVVDSIPLLLESSASKHAVLKEGRCALYVPFDNKVTKINDEIGEALCDPRSGNTFSCRVTMGMAYTRVQPNMSNRHTRDSDNTLLQKSYGLGIASFIYEDNGAAMAPASHIESALGIMMDVSHHC